MVAPTFAPGTLFSRIFQASPVAMTVNALPDGRYIDVNDSEEVLRAMGDASIRTEYAIPLEMYGGAHIPGSSVVSAMDLMQGMDTLVSDDALAARLDAGAGFERIITYCGGGIAATINAAAHLMTGHTNVAVYDGSLYEWLGEGLPVNGQGQWEIWRQK